MAVTFNCRCGYPFTATDDQVGQELNCPGCGRGVRVPAAAGKVTAPQAQAAEIHFGCTCGKTFTVPGSRAGQRGKCSACGQEIVVPQESASESLTATALFSYGDNPPPTDVGEFSATQLFALKALQDTPEAQPITTGLKIVKKKVEPKQQSRMKANRSMVGQTCTVCATPIAFGQEVRPCEACKNVYHFACWHENGGCNTHACRNAPKPAVDLPETIPFPAAAPASAPAQRRPQTVQPNVPRNYNMKPCPDCGQPISATAPKCRYCGSTFDGPAVAQASAPNNNLLIAGMVGVVVIVVLATLVFLKGHSPDATDDNATPAAATGNATSNTGNATSAMGGVNGQGCMTNLRDLAMAFQMYLKDNDQVYPAYLGAPPANNGWAQAVQSYLKTPKSLWCPSETGTQGSDPAQAHFTSYFFNRNLSGRRFSLLTMPAKTLVAGDGDGAAAGSTASYSDDTEQESGVPAADIRHDAGGNYLFADGSAQWLKAHTLSGGQENKIFKKCHAPDSDTFTFCYM